MQIMNDKYGNYFFQKLLQFSTPEKRTAILRDVRFDFLQLARNEKGTHALQSMIDMISTSSEEELLKDMIKGHVVPLSIDSQGTHII